MQLTIGLAPELVGSWFDKSFNLILFSNSRACLNVEHSWADAPVAAHMWEWMLSAEFNGPGYDDVTGFNKAIPQEPVKMAPPLRLRFNIKDEARSMMDLALANAKRLIDGKKWRVHLYI